MPGMPAARVGDNHVCPMVTGVVPHVGGPIAMGEPTVLTGNMLQARVGDPCVCVGPPDSIVMGAFTVLVGKKPAARIGDMTAHGGVIVVGLPTVLIGASPGEGGGGGAGAPGGGAGGAAKDAAGAARNAASMALAPFANSTIAFHEATAQARTWIRAAIEGSPFCELCGR